MNGKVIAIVGGALLVTGVLAWAGAAPAPQTTPATQITASPVAPTADSGDPQGITADPNGVPVTPEGAAVLITDTATVADMQVGEWAILQTATMPGVKYAFSPENTSVVKPIMREDDSFAGFVVTAPGSAYVLVLDKDEKVVQMLQVNATA